MWISIGDFLNQQLPAGSLTIIAGRPAMGCTSLARQLMSSERLPKVRRAGVTYECQNHGGLLLDLAQSRREESGVPVLDPPIYPAVMEAKALAARLNLPVIVTCSLQREIEERPDARPTLEDFIDAHGREAASAADMIVLLYRDAYYKEEVWNITDYSAEIYVVKNSFGNAGTIHCRWVQDPEHNGILFCEGKTISSGLRFM